MVKGWWEGEGNVIGGTGDDMVEQGSQSFARANVRWGIVGIEAPPIVG